MSSLRSCLLPLAIATLAACSGAASAPREDAADGAAEAAPDASPADAGADTVIVVPAQDGASTQDAAFPDGALADAALPDAPAPEAASPAEAGPLPEAGCPTGDLLCNGTCVPRDVHNCGTCGQDCSKLAHVAGATSCTAAGACILPAASCAAGWADCNGDPDDGCETDVTTPAHCGSCTTSCPASAPLCEASGTTYACATGCSSAAPSLCSGACVDTTTNPNDCGTCGHACASAVANAQPTCAASKCGFTCNAGYNACPAAPALAATCVDEQTDDANCGGCGVACGGGEHCVAGKCACTNDTHLCGSPATCVADDVNACGASCTACTAPANAAPSCDGTSCHWTCNAGFTGCPAASPIACDNLAANNANCGACGHGCTGGETCQSGACACPAGETLCGGTCVSEASDASNCGACGHTCLGGTCSGGQCQPVTLTTFPGNGDSITLDADTVYFTNASGLYSCPKTGCASASFLAAAKYGRVLYAQPYLWVTEQNDPSTGTSFVDQYLTNGTLNDVVYATMEGAQGMATDGTSTVYVGYGGGVDAIPINVPGSSASILDSVSAFSVAVDPANTAHIYATEDLPSGRIFVVAPNVAGIFASGQVNPVSISVAGSRVFWANLGTSANNFGDGSVYMCPTGGGGSCASTSMTLLTTGNYCGSVSTDASYVYFNCNATLYKCPLSGCGAGPTGLAGAFDILGPTLTNDATALYWVTEFGELMKLAK